MTKEELQQRRQQYLKSVHDQENRIKKEILSYKDSEFNFIVRKIAELRVVAEAKVNDDKLQNVRLLSLEKHVSFIKSIIIKLFENARIDEGEIVLDQKLLHHLKDYHDKMVTK